MRDGDFILYHADRRAFRNKGQPSSGLPNDDAKAVDDFFATAIEKLLSILKDNQLTRLIPNSVLSLAKSIVARLDPSSQQQQAAPYFLCTRWLFASYLSSLITSPESHGLLLSHHISSTVRQRILHELAHRTRQVMEGVAYSWKQTSPILPHLIEKIETIVDLFRLGPLESESVPDTRNLGSNIPGSSSRYNRQIMLCASEVVNAIHSLYPENSHDLCSGLHILGGSTLRSSASSVSGLSLFQTMSPSEPASPRNGRCDVVPEVGTPTGFSVPSAAPMGRSQDHASVSAGDSFSHRLREACIELAVSTGGHSDIGRCDLFSEQWTCLETCFNHGTTSWIDYASHEVDYDRLKMDFFPEQLIDSETFVFLSTGIVTLLDGFSSAATLNDVTTPKDDHSVHSSLLNKFESARANCYHQGDFAQAHLFFRLAKTTTSLSPGLTSQIIQAVAEEFHHSIDICRLKIQKGEAQIERINDRINSQQAEIRSLSYINDRLREKMWYTADIQRAGHYEELRKVVTALRVMASTNRPRTDKKKPLLRHLSASKSLNQNVQLKAEAATLELLSAPAERGGTNKLSDIQIDMSMHWMQARGVERVCRAEERIHRFCSELTRCIDHFVGQSIVDNPILWSSPLFENQKTVSDQFYGRIGTPSSEPGALTKLRSMYDNNVSGSYEKSQASFLDELKQNLTSLLLSDFHDLFRSGSETDKAMRKMLKLRLPCGVLLSDATEYKSDASQSSFDFDQVFRMLLRRFELQASPYVKLDILLELQSMLKAYRVDRGLEDVNYASQSNANLFVQHRPGLRIDPSSAPRTSLGHDSTILSFRQLFQDPQLRPKTLFRDLQYIASLVPLNILDSTPRGRAFWNATIAALDVKEEICQSMIETAGQIIQHHTFNRGHSRVTSAAQAKRDAAAFSPPIPQPSDPSVTDLSMSDAAMLLQLTAKEGIPAAQRELATLYLTNPDLLGICLPPFSKVKDVFKDVDKDREAASERYDPVAMAVARHWMELSAKGGDEHGVGVLRVKDEFDRIP
ncbi:hypothetical protein KCU95_g14268, partial [Aureobasidium melanogenum]